MRQTVVGVFDQAAAARAAAQQLRDSGFGDSVFVTDDVDEASTDARDHQGVFASVRSFFSELFGPDEQKEMSPYAEAVRRGGAIVKVEVEADAQADVARAALEAAGAVDIEERATEWRASGWTDEPYYDAAASAGASNRSTGLSGPNTSTAAGAADAMLGSTSDLGSGAASEATMGSPGARVTTDPDDTLAGRGSLGGAAAAGSALRSEGPTASTTGTMTDNDVIPVVQEDLRVGKRVVQTGGVRVYTRVVDTPVHESIDLRSVHAHVERRDVDRPATEADFQAGDRSIEIVETAERPVVAKEARVVEEVSVGKTVERRAETISDSVRHTEVEVESVDGDTTADTDTGAWRNHFDSNFAAGGGRWDDYQPAYLYGRTMRGDPRYASGDWDAVEPQLRSGWEARGAGPWERFKAAVRHGWDRMTS